MRLLLLAPLLFATGCMTRVYNPARTAEQQVADIRFCSDQANRKYWMDSIAALYNAYDCLEAKGYTREQPGISVGLERALGEKPSRKAVVSEPCAVPCRRPS